MKELEKKVIRWAEERNLIKGSNPESQMMKLIEEVGELAQAIRKGSHEERAHEFGDVLAWTFSLANQVGVDIEKAIQRYIDTPP